MEGKDRELLGVLLLAVSTDKIIGRFKVAGGQVIGYDGAGAEVVRVPLREPTMVRPFHDPRIRVYRHNVT
jgi:nitrate reductase beta subunit